MNIAIYTNILTPYRKYFYDLMYEECRKRGDEFHVICMAETEPNRNWNYSELKTCYTILLKGKTFSYGETYIHINLKLKDILSKLQLDILICAGSYLCPGVWCSIKWKKKLKYNILYWSESHLNETRNYSRFKIAVREKIRRSIYQKFDGFWYAGQLSLMFINKYALPGKKMIYVPNLVDNLKFCKAGDQLQTTKVALREKYGIKHGQMVFICPARLSTVKGIDKFIEVLGKTKSKDKIIIFVAGDGEERDKIEAKAKKAMVDVRLLGFQKQKTIIDLYSISDVFLLPSLSDPNPLSCIEALWAGLPLFISYHCGNYPEVVIEGENGYVFSYEDENKTIKKLETIINASDEWKKNAKLVSRRIAEEKFNSQIIIRNIIDSLHLKEK